MNEKLTSQSELSVELSLEKIYFLIAQTVIPTNLQLIREKQNNLYIDLNNHYIKSEPEENKSGTEKESTQPSTVDSHNSYKDNHNKAVENGMNPLVAMCLSPEELKEYLAK
jgi:hypothetical protein